MAAEFEERKRRAVAAIDSDSPDRSRKGGIDAPISDLISRINAHPDYFTTSSCSGRITLFTEPSASQIIKVSNGNGNSTGKTAKKKKKGGEWALVSHEPVVAANVVAAVRGFVEGGQPDMLVFRFEPFILALDCVSVAAAQELVACAIASGFRESGITGAKKRVMVAIRCSIRLEVPVAENGELLVTDEYLSFLSALANRKMEQNKLRTDKFFEAFVTQFQCGAQSTLNSIIEVTHDEHFKVEIAEDGRANSHDFEDLSALGCPVAGMNEMKKDELCPEKTASLSRIYAGWIDESPGSFLRAEPVPGTPAELQRWGHSACTVNPTTLLIFGGYGGTGSHARLSDIVLYSPHSQRLERLDLQLSPRMAHTASAVNGKVWIIGGRRGPHHLLSDVIVIDAEKRELITPAAISGAAFTPRHRHAAAVVDDNIYVHGGLGEGAAVLGDLYVLDTAALTWAEVKCRGDVPSERYSHSLCAVGRKLYLFGGFDGRNIFGDLHVLDTDTLTWSRVLAAGGDGPVGRFSHSSTVVGKYMVVLGGCPTIKQMNCLFLLDVSTMVWEKRSLRLPCGALLVRHAACLVDNLLVVTGGGASCYAFGTMFNSSFSLNSIEF